MEYLKSLRLEMVDLLESCSFITTFLFDLERFQYKVYR